MPILSIRFAEPDEQRNIGLVRRSNQALNDHFLGKSRLAVDQFGFEVHRAVRLSLRFVQIAFFQGQDGLKQDGLDEALVASQGLLQIGDRPSSCPGQTACSGRVQVQVRVARIVSKGDFEVLQGCGRSAIVEASVAQMRMAFGNVEASGLKFGGIGILAEERSECLACFFIVGAIEGREGFLKNLVARRAKPSIEYRHNSDPAEGRNAGLLHRPTAHGASNVSAGGRVKGKGPPGLCAPASPLAT
jgi:hypothetical protein